MTCTRRIVKYEVILRGIPSKPVILFSTVSKKVLRARVSLLRLDKHPGVFVRTYRKTDESYTVKSYQTWLDGEGAIWNTKKVKQ